MTIVVHLDLLTPMAISMAFVILERMTNPCFQDTEFATVMKG
jgi:hypothetical protein